MSLNIKNKTERNELIFLFFILGNISDISSIGERNFAMQNFSCFFIFLQKPLDIFDA